LSGKAGVWLLDAVMRLMTAGVSLMTEGTRLTPALVAPTRASVRFALSSTPLMPVPDDGAPAPAGDADGGRRLTGRGGAKQGGRERLMTQSLLPLLPSLFHSPAGMEIGRGGGSLQGPVNLATTGA